MRSDTSRAEADSGEGPIGLSCASRLSQGSCQRLIENPSPTAYPIFFNKRSRPTKIPLQPWEISVVSEARRKLLSAKYFPFNIFPSKESGLSSSLHPIFANRESFNFMKSRIPSPPTTFGVAILSHATQTILRVLSLLSHQNRVTTDWIRWHKELGSLKHVIE